MPYVHTYEIADSLGLTKEHIYALANLGRRAFFPRGKFAKKGKPYPMSMYSMDSFRIMQRTFEEAPGETPEEKHQAILDGFDITDEEAQQVINQATINTEQLHSIESRLTQFMDLFKGKGILHKKRLEKPSQLPDVFGNMNPDQIFESAEAHGLDPKHARFLAVKRDDDEVVTHIVSWLDTFEAGTKLHADEIVDEIANFNEYVGEKVRPKSHAWRGLRNKLLATKRLKAKANGYLQVE